MITLIVTIVVVWTVIRIVQFVTRLWSGADAAGSPRIGVIAAPPRSPRHQFHDSPPYGKKT